MSPHRACIRGPRGCSGPALPGTSRCRAHTKSNWGRTPRPYQAVYKSTQWRDVAARVLREQPTCAVDGCRARSAAVDHIVSLADGGDPYARENLRGLCREHHNRRTAQQGAEAANKKRKRKK